MLSEAVLVNTDYRSRIKHLMQPFEVVGVRDVTLVRYRLPKFRRKLRQEVTCRIIGHIRFTSIRMVHHQFAVEKDVPVWLPKTTLFQNNISSIQKIESKSIVARRYKRNIF